MKHLRRPLSLLPAAKFTGTWRQVCVCALLVAVSACGQATGLEDISVASASLRDLTTFEFAVIGGGSSGRAVLDVVTTEGETLAIDVDVGGGVVGGMMEVGVTRLYAEAPFDLSLVEAPTGGDLLGTYEGFVASGVMLIGAELHALENEQHISLDLGGFATNLGLSMLVGHEWLTLSVSEEPTVDEDPQVPDETADNGT